MIEIPLWVFILLCIFASPMLLLAIGLLIIISISIIGLVILPFKKEEDRNGYIK